MSQAIFSVEFFPPKTAEGVDKLKQARQQLAQIKPAYFSVTFGAAGSTQAGTRDTVLEIQQEGFHAAPHLSCIGRTRDDLRAIINEYKAHGIRHIIALRGDLPSGFGGTFGELHYASDLIAFIREETGDWFHIEAAAYPEMHPQAKSPQDDLQNFVRKVKAGANAGITQYFYNPDAYFRLVEDGADGKALRETVDKLKDKLGSALVVLGSVEAPGKVTLIAGVTQDLTSRVRAGDLVGFVAAQVGGKGGGRPDMAQGGGTDAAGLGAALASVAAWAGERL